MIWRLIVSVLTSLLHVLVCQHPHRYRERRELHGVLVPHLVCDTCGDAEPMIQRTPAEHQAMAVRGALTPFRVRTQPQRRPEASSGRAAAITPIRRSG